MILEQKGSLGLEEAAPGFSPGPSLGGNRGQSKRGMNAYLEVGKKIQTVSFKQL